MCLLCLHGLHSANSEVTVTPIQRAANDRTTSKFKFPPVSETVKYRLASGWKDIHEEFIQAPYYSIFQRIAKIIKWRKYSHCRKDGLCFVCSNKGIYTLHPRIAENIDKIPKTFIKVW